MASPPSALRRNDCWTSLIHVLIIPCRVYPVLFAVTMKSCHENIFYSLWRSILAWPEIICIGAGELFIVWLDEKINITATRSTKNFWLCYGVSNILDDTKESRCREVVLTGTVSHNRWKRHVRILRRSCWKHKSYTKIQQMLLHHNSDNSQYRYY